MDNPTSDGNLREKLCRAFCSFYKPGEKEELSCRGYQAVASLLSRGKHIDFVRRHDYGSPEPYAVLEAQLCPECPFYESDCDYAEKKEQALPCGGFLFLSQMLGQGSISIDDIRKLD